MKRQIAGILTGLLVCSAFLAGCGKNEATQAVKESVETEKEGNGESTEAEGKDQDKKSDAEETDGSTEESSGEDQAPEVVLDKIGILLPEERSDMNGSLERAELKSRLEENGYDAALYFAKEDADTQISQIRELLQDENLKALVISPVDPYSLSDVLQEASDQSIPVIDYDDDIIALNPGSLSHPRQEGHQPSYILMEIDKTGQAHFSIHFLKKNEKGC